VKDKNTMTSIKHTTILILHNVRSAHNVGSIFRTADAAGVTKIYLTGYTPTPTDRLGRKQNNIAKTALGAEKTISWEYSTSTKPIIAKLKKDGFIILGVEQSLQSCDYKSVSKKGSLALVFGNEVRGLSKALLQRLDGCIFIPMLGTKESLNVSVAVGIVLFRVRNI